MTEIGVIYKCRLKEPTKCEPFNFDTYGNIADNYAYDFKDNSWLGACMDSGDSDHDAFVVRYIFFILKKKMVNKLNLRKNSNVKTV